MKSCLIGILLTAILSTGCLTDLESPVEDVRGDLFDFDTYTAGELPPGWSQYGVGGGVAAWKVVPGDPNQVLAQTMGANPNHHYNLAIWDGLVARDVILKVRFRSIAGRHDQGGGLVWRFQDPNNHYIVRANPLENNVVAYKMEMGVRTDLPLLGQGRTYGVKTDLLVRGWHELQLKAQGDLFTVYLDDRPLFQVRDSTFASPGKVGLWTKADAVTWFDHLQIMNP